MRFRIKIYLFSLTVGLLFSTGASAFFANDKANLVLDKLETVQSYKEKGEQYLFTAKKILEQAKAGDFGPEAVKTCVASIKALDVEKAQPKHKSASFISKKVTADKSELNDSVLANVPQVINPEGGQMDTVKSQARKIAEILGNDTAIAWGNATATRANYYKEIKLEAPTINMKDARSIIQASMGYTQKNAKIWLNIMSMEANIASIQAFAEGGNFTFTTEDVPTPTEEAAPDSTGGATPTNPDKGATGAGGVK